MRLLSCHFTTCDNLGGSATVTACAFETPTLTLEEEEEEATAANVCLKFGRNELRRLVVSVEAEEAEEEDEILESQGLQRIAGAAAAAPSTLAMAAIKNEESLTPFFKTLQAPIPTRVNVND